MLWMLRFEDVISIDDDHSHIFQGMGCKTTWRNSSLGDICKHIKFWASAKPSSLEQKIVQKHWTFSVQLRKYIPSHLLKCIQCVSIKFILHYMMKIPFYKFSQVFVFLILFLYCLITSPFLLVAMAMSGGGCYYASLKQVKHSFHVFYICGMYFKTIIRFSANCWLRYYHIIVISIVYAVNQI